jgi:hypothetical protein
MFVTMPDDYFVSSSASFLLEYYTLFANSSDVQTTTMASLGKDVIKTEQGSLASWLLNIVALARGQLYSKVDRMLDTLFLVLLFGIIGLLILLCAQYRQHAQLVAEHKGDSSNGVKEGTQETLDDYNSIATEVRPWVLQLESVLRTAMASAQPEMSPEQIEAAVSARMQGLASRFLKQA